MSDPSNGTWTLRWWLEHGAAVLAVAGILVSGLIGLAYGYSYSRLGVDPSEVGLTVADLLLHAAAGLGFLAVFVVGPTGVLVLLHLGTIGPDARPARIPRWTRRDVLAFAALVVGAAVLSPVVGHFPEALVDVAFPIVATFVLGGGLFLVLRSHPRLEEGLSRPCWRAIVDVSLMDYASLVCLLACATVVTAMVLSRSFEVIVVEIAAVAFTLALLTFAQARRWSKSFQRTRADHRRRLVGMPAPVAAVAIVLAWIVVGSLVDTVRAPAQLQDHGRVAASVTARLRTKSITCVHIDWLDGGRPDIPDHALHLGQDGGTAVLYVPKQGPVRLPSGRIVLTRQPDARCRV